MFGGLAGVARCLFVMLGRGLGVSGSFLEVAFFVKVGGFLLMSRGVVIVIRGLTVVLCGVRHA